MNLSMTSFLKFVIWKFEKPTAKKEAYDSGEKLI